MFREVTSHRNDTGLADPMRHQPPHRILREMVREIHDGSTVGHDTFSRETQKERRAEIDTEYLVPLRRGHRIEGQRNHRSGGVDEGIEPAKRSLRGIDKLLWCIGLAEVS